jgi:hypothetical protein
MAAMRPSLTLTFILLLAAWPLSPVVQAQENGEALRGVLEAAYGRWRDAIIRKDPVGWASSITRYRQTKIRNEIVSELRSFPEAVFSADLQPPPLTGLRHLEAEAAGVTAHLVYYGKVDMGQDRELLKDNLLKLRFYQEAGVWKYDSNRIISLDSVPEVRTEIVAGRRPEFLDSPEYTPPGTMPPPPPLCRVPEFKAGYKLQSFGYEAILSAGGCEHAPVQDSLEQQVLIGGLVKGRNEIRLKIRPGKVPDGEKPALQIRIYLLPNDSNLQGREVLRWQAPEGSVPAEVTLPFDVNP